MAPCKVPAAFPGGTWEPLATVAASLPTRDAVTASAATLAARMVARQPDRAARARWLARAARLPLTVARTR